jgi:hypothetical protein
MNIPGKIDVKLPSLILENNSSNNAVWGQIFGDITNQDDLIKLLNDDSIKLRKIGYIEILTEPNIGQTYIIDKDDIEDGGDIKETDFVYGLIKFNDTDYFIFSSIEGIAATTVTIKIENSIKQIEYVHDPNYVHTDNNYTNVEKDKVADIQDNAQVNIQSDWSQTIDTEDDYIRNKPTINNPIITVQKNSVSVGSFTLNQSNGQTINIPVSKNDTGLDQVDNTSDINKPISNATQSAFNTVQDQINEILDVIPNDTTETNALVNQAGLDGIVGDGTITLNVNSIKAGQFSANQYSDTTINLPFDKNSIGLDQVNNTSDINKPVSNAA